MGNAAYYVAHYGDARSIKAPKLSRNSSVGLARLTSLSLGVHMHRDPGCMKMPNAVNARLRFGLQLLCVPQFVFSVLIAVGPSPESRLASACQ